MKTIFIIDDNETNLLVAKQALDGLYRTFAIPSAEKMFGLLDKIRPDLILMDVEMPGMDGITALTLLKESPKTAAIPVIMVTLYSVEVLQEQAFSAGAADFITKPFPKPVLLNRVATQIKNAEMKMAFDSIVVHLLAGDRKAALEVANSFREEWAGSNING